MLAKPSAPRVKACRWAARFPVVVLLLVAAMAADAAAEFRFRVQPLPERLEVGYAVTVVDMNADGRTDIVVVDTNRVIWFENPSWRVHTLIQDQTKRDNVCIAPYDIDGDGRTDFALGADWRPIDTRTGGTIQWLSPGSSSDGPWEVHPIGEEPTTHRMRWADLDGDGRKELLVAPMMGRDSTKPLWMETPLRLLAYRIPADPVHDAWQPQVISQELHVAHNLWPTDLDHDGQIDILLASFEGVTLLKRGKDGRWHGQRIGEGNQDNPEARGASEIKHGLLAGGDYVATIEPWHGFQVVVYTRPADAAQALWDRHVLDADLKWGHAVWCANLDDDADEELVIGVRDDKDESTRCGLRIYDPQESGLKWSRQLIDPGGVNIEDLTVADFNGDGRNDIVAVGRQSHNIKIYWNER
ncbi:MAG TPA: VCBS repeat-containing protein [Pirellulales bacterium]|nr:VCBS repeat-containing protein [Pirellulales bacterium]